MKKATKIDDRQSSKPLRLIGYVRVSTEDQAIHGVSLAAQAARLKAHGKAHGYELVTIEKDEGVSGKIQPWKRDGLKKGLSAIKLGQAEGLVFWKLDRLSRSVKDILKLADEAKRDNWHLVSVNEHIDTSTASGKFTLGVLALLAEMERDQIGERTRFGLAQVAREGRSRSSRLPFGYRIEGASRATSMKAGDRRKLVEHKEETKILRQMLRLRASGKGAYLIAKTLNQKQTINPRIRAPWTHSTVAAILRTADRRAVFKQKKNAA